MNIPLPPDSTETEYMMLFRLPSDDMWEGSLPNVDLEWLKGRKAVYKQRWPTAEIHIIERTTTVTTRLVDPETP